MVLFFDAWCYGQAEIDVAPMEKAEQEALYSAIQGFVGNWWNGSDLYPDPCGWTPIQVLLLHIFAFFFSFFFPRSGPFRFCVHGKKLIYYFIMVFGYLKNNFF